MSDSIEVIALGAGRFRLVQGNSQRIGYAVSDATHTWVFIEGTVHVVGSDEPSRRRGRTGAEEHAALASPMPASVASVNVTVGQQVVRGDVLVTLEAMKMEFPIKAPRDSIVRSVSCQPGDLVQPGVALVELE